MTLAAADTGGVSIYFHCIQAMVSSSTIGDGRGHAGCQPEILDEEGQGVADAARDGHQAAYNAAQQGGAAAGQLAVIGQGLGEAHADARTERGREADQEGIVAVLRGERRGKHGGESADRAVHQPDQAGLDDL